MLWLVAGLILFHTLHSVRMVAPAWRDGKMASMGEGKWKGAYSLVSIIALVILIWGYSLARQDFNFVYAPPSWGLHLALLLMAASFVSLMIFNLPAGVLKPKLKHPMLLSIMLWSIAHLLVNGDMASFLLFGSFLGWAIINRVAVARRSDPLPAAGPIRNDIIAIVTGLGLWVLFIWVAHEWLFGVAPIA